MRSRSLRHLDDHQVLEGTIRAYQSVRSRTVEFLHLLAEFDLRKLYREAGYPSAHQFCMQHMEMSEDQAFRFLRTARAGRRFPIVFEMIADGRSNVSAITILSRRLTREHGEDLLASAAGMTNEQVRMMLAERFPEPDKPTVMFALARRLSPPWQDVSEMTCKVALTPPEASNALPNNEMTPAFTAVEAVDRQVVERDVVVGGPVAPFPYTCVSPLSPASFALQCTLSARAHGTLREVQDLLGPRVSRDDVPQVLELALETLKQKLQRERQAALKRPAKQKHAEGSSAPARRSSDRSGTPRHVPASVRRSVWVRDEGRCQFVSADGSRCECQSGLELDHVHPVALGGASTLENLRLLCPAHNQLEAERRFGREFMERKRRRA